MNNGNPMSFLKNGLIRVKTLCVAKIRMFPVFFVLLTSIFSVNAEPIVRSSVYVSDVTDKSFIVTWSASPKTQPALEMFADISGSEPVDLANSSIRIEPQYIVNESSGLSEELAAKGVYRIRVSGLVSGEVYYFSVKNTNPQDETEVSRVLNGPLFSVRTLPRVEYFNNDSLAAEVSSENNNSNGKVIFFRVEGAAYPISHIVGDSFPEKIAAVSLSNMASKDSQVSISNNQILIDEKGAFVENTKFYDLPETTQEGKLHFIAGVEVLGDALDSDGDGLPDWYEDIHGLNNGIDDSALDLDGDGLSNLSEYLYGSNPKERDTDGDGISDFVEINTLGTSATDADTDNDGISDYDEIHTHNTDPLDSDSDNDGVSDGIEVETGTDANDAEDTPAIDDDNDGFENESDNCPSIPNPTQENTDGDEYGDFCDSDDDNDGVEDRFDNAPLVYNPDQKDEDSDSIGDVIDNCVSAPNRNQLDNDRDGLGDVCDDDDDNDGVLDLTAPGTPSEKALVIKGISSIIDINIPRILDNRAVISLSKKTLESGTIIDLAVVNLKTKKVSINQLTATELNVEGKLIVSIDAANCDCFYMTVPESNFNIVTDQGTLTVVLPNYSPNDSYNSVFISKDGSSFRNDYVSNPTDLTNLLQTSLFPQPLDNCQFTPNSDQSDLDGDGKGDACDITAEDSDGDGILNVNDICPNHYDPEQNDFDSDGLGDHCDADADNDGVSNYDEENILHTNPLSQNSLDSELDDGEMDFDGDGTKNADELLNGTNIDLVNIKLEKGFNLAYFPNTDSLKLASDLALLLGGSQKINSIKQVDASGKVVNELSVNGNQADSEDFEIVSQKGVIIDANEELSYQLPERASCSDLNLLKGANLIGFNCIPSKLTAFSFLELVGSEMILDIRRYNSNTGLFETAAFNSNSVVGKNFKVLTSEAYIVTMKQDSVFTQSNITPSEVSLNYSEDSYIVTTNSITLSGFISSNDISISINGNIVNIQNGQLTATNIPLEEGVNIVDIIYRDAYGFLIQRTLTVEYRAPANIVIDSHYDGQVSNSKLTTVRGNLSEAPSSVVVNGVQAIIDNKSFIAHNIELAEGENTINVSAVVGGVSASKTITVFSKPIMVRATINETVALSNTIHIGSLDEEDKVDLVYAQDQSPSYIYWTRTETVPSERSVYQFNSTVRVKNEGKFVGVHDFLSGFLFKNVSGETVRREILRYRLYAAPIDNSAEILITSHSDGQEVEQSKITFSGRLLGSYEEIFINGIKINVIDDTFSNDIELKNGNNLILIEAVGGDSVVKKEFELHYHPNALRVFIDSHQHLENVSEELVELSGKVNNKRADIYFAGQLLDVDDNGRFTFTTELEEGINRITVKAQLGLELVHHSVHLVKNNYDLKLSGILDRQLLRKQSVSGILISNEVITRFRVNGGSWTEGGAEELPFGTGYFFLQEGRNKVLVEAEFADGTIQSVERVVFYQPIELTLNFPEYNTVSFDYYLPMSDMQNVSSVRLRGDSFSDVNHVIQYPFIGKVFDIKDLTVNPYKLTEYAHVSMETKILAVDQFALKPGALFGFRPVQDMDLEFYDETAKLIKTEKVNVIFRVGTVSNKQEIFVLSHEDGGSFHASHVPIFGIVSNMRPTKVEINGVEAQIFSYQGKSGDLYPRIFKSTKSASGYGIRESMQNFIISAQDQSQEELSKSFRLNYKPYEVTLKAELGQSLEIFDKIPFARSVSYWWKEDVRGPLNRKFSRIKEYAVLDSDEYSYFGALKHRILIETKPDSDGSLPERYYAEHRIPYPYSGTTTINYDIGVNLVDSVDEVPELSLLSPSESFKTFRSSEEIVVKVSNDAFANVYVDGALATRDKYTHRLEKELNPGVNEFDILAEGWNGKKSVLPVAITLEQMPRPSFEVTSHSDGQTIEYFSESPQSVSIKGIYDNNIPLNQVKVNGIVARLEESSFEAEVSISDGMNSILIEAINDAGTTSSRFNLESVGAKPEITISYPESNLETTADSIEVVGVVNDTFASVVANGVSANVSSSGGFSVIVPLQDGSNTVLIKAENYHGVTESSLVINKQAMQTENHSIVPGTVGGPYDWSVAVTADEMSQIAQFRTSTQSLPRDVNFNLSFVNFSYSPTRQVNFTYQISMPSTVTESFAFEATVTLLDSNSGVIKRSIKRILVDVAEKENQPPRVSIINPDSNVTISVSDNFALSAEAYDEGSNISEAVTWTSDLDGALGRGMSITVNLSIGTHTIRALISDGEFSAVDEIIVTVVNSQNQSPALSIISPNSGDSFDLEQSITFTASALDPEDGEITNLIEWFSNLDGSIGVGGVISTALSEGQHEVRATITDSEGAVSSESLILTVMNFQSSIDSFVTVEAGSRTEAVSFNVEASPDELNGLASFGMNVESSPSFFNSFNVNFVSWSGNVITLGYQFSASNQAPAGLHKIILKITFRNSSGDELFSRNVDINVTIPEPDNNSPQISIVSPNNGITIDLGENILLSASATDAEDGDLTSSISWRSSIDGSLGAGNNISVALTQGEHVITAEVTDSGGRSSTANRNVTVVNSDSGANVIEISMMKNSTSTLVDFEIPLTSEVMSQLASYRVQFSSLPSGLTNPQLSFMGFSGASLKFGFQIQASSTIEVGVYSFNADIAFLNSSGQELMRYPLEVRVNLN
ncbi:MAG: thrombospondin type 3 repeat-containing protein [Gammaproteobacteria bacterium]|nr:thrombospondin type 3 repeat-containing protein [Gammaproteobacteria bacterium]